MTLRPSSPSRTSRRSFCSRAVACSAAAALESSAILRAAGSQPAPTASATRPDVAAIDHDRILAAAQNYLTQPPTPLTSLICPRSPGAADNYYLSPNPAPMHRRAVLKLATTLYRPSRRALLARPRRARARCRLFAHRRSPLRRPGRRAPSRMVRRSRHPHEARNGLRPSHSSIQRSAGHARHRPLSRGSSKPCRWSRSPRPFPSSQHSTTRTTPPSAPGLPLTSTGSPSLRTAARASPSSPATARATTPPHGCCRPAPSPTSPRPPATPPAPRTPRSPSCVTASSPPPCARRSHPMEPSPTNSRLAVALPRLALQSGHARRHLPTALHTGRFEGPQPGLSARRGPGNARRHRLPLPLHRRPLHLALPRRRRSLRGAPQPPRQPAALRTRLPPPGVRHALEVPQARPAHACGPAHTAHPSASGVGPPAGLNA